MCGIAGLIYKEQDQPVDPSLLKRMADVIAHRGPDDEGFHIRKNVGLAHRRLSIIDLSGGHQPIYNDDKSVCIVFNGEIYNHESLRDTLVKLGYQYRTRSDTETILHAYQAWGPDCVKHLRGMFAFCIHDARKNLVFIARDRAGKKPVYYYRDENSFVFASEVKAILESGLVRKEVNRSAINFYLSIGYVPGAQSMFKNIFKLEPGHYAVLDSQHHLEIKEYWDLKDLPTLDISYEDAKKTLSEKLIESVKIRLMSEVPLGVFLSGGLDSSAIVGLMSQIVDKPIKTFSVGYENEPESSELGYASIVAKKFKTEHHEFYLKPDDLFTSIDAKLEHCDEPVVESAGIALMKLSMLAKPMVTVILSGEGADEILAGYPIYSKMKTMERIHAVARLCPQALRRLFLSDAVSEKKLKYLDWVFEPFEKRFRSVSYDLSDSMKQKIYSPELLGAPTESFNGYFENLHDKVKDQTQLRRMMYIDIKTWLAEDILLKADRMTMAASIEMRAPFLDHKLMEFCLALPDSYKLQNGVGKKILRDVMKDLLPAEIIHRKKKGFPVPLTSWFRNELHDKAKDLLTNPTALGRGYLKPDYVKGLFTKIKQGQDLGRRIFSLVVLELWHRKFIDCS
jgi:asparagine synthase (glutamine-hydrolysing)